MIDHIVLIKLLGSLLSYPHVVWPDGTIGIPLDTIATKRVTSSHNQNNMGDNQLSALSEQNLLRHNVAAGLGQESSKN